MAGELDSPFKYHRACRCRAFMGSVIHQERRCMCFGGTEQEWMTGIPADTMQQALEAYEHFVKVHGRPFPRSWAFV